MVRASAFLAVGLVGCGAAQTVASSVETATETVSLTVDVAATEGEASTPAETQTASQTILDGRFEISLPLGLRPSDAWSIADGPRGYYDSYDFNMGECAFTLALRSDGLLRPANLQLGEGESRSFVPAESASPHLEVVTTRWRSWDVLGTMVAPLGAVAFEPDGTATDFFLWPHLGAREESAELEGEFTTEDWFAAQRDDPRLARCYEVGERLLQTALPTLVARRPFASAQTRLYFGYDIDMDAHVAYAGSIPEGWVITSEAAYDARFDDLHRRLPWAWNAPVAEARARVWMFTGTWPDDEPRPRLGSRREHLFDHDLRFDRGESAEGHCASIENVELGLTHTVCLRGTRAEQNEIAAILRTFQRVQVAQDAAPPSAPLTCVTRIADADGQTHVRSQASSRSQVIGTVPNDTIIAPVEQRGSWLRITTPHAGWVFADNIERRCE